MSERKTRRRLLVRLLLLLFLLLISFVVWHSIPPTDRPIHISSFATPRDDADAAIYSRPVAVVYCYYYVPWAAAAAAV